MKNNIKIILIIISIAISSMTSGTEVPVYNGSERTYMSVTQNSKINEIEDGILICWFEESMNGSIKIQKLNNDGMVMWTENGVIIETELGTDFSEETDYPYIFSDDEGGALVIFRKKYFDREEILLKRISVKGETGENTVRISSQERGYNFSPAAVLTNDGRIAIVWESFEEGDFNIHGQLLDLQGNKIWNNGEPLQICSMQYDQRRPSITCDKNNILFISWLDSRKHTEYVFDVYAKVLDLNLSGIKDNSDGTMIFRNAISNNSRKLTMYNLNTVPVDKSSFLLAFEYSYDNLFNDVKIIKVNSDLENEWEITIDSDSDQKNPFIAEIDDRRTCIFWNDIGSDHNEIYGIVTDKDGNIKWGGNQGSRISYDCSGQTSDKVMPFSKNSRSSYFLDNVLYISWATKEIKNLYVSSIHLTDGSFPGKCSEQVQEKISEGEYTSISANENNLIMVYKQSDYIYAAIKDISKQGIIKTEEIPVVKNYPNPFNPATKISFNIPADGFIRLSVFDVRGKLVKELINEYRSGGNYQIGFNGSNLSSGVYYYRLEVNGKSYVNKMTLLK